MEQFNLEKRADASVRYMQLHNSVRVAEPVHIRMFVCVCVCECVSVVCRNICTRTYITESVGFYTCVCIAKKYYHSQYSVSGNL